MNEQESNAYFMRRLCSTFRAAIFTCVVCVSASRSLLTLSTSTLHDWLPLCAARSNEPYSSAPQPDEFACACNSSVAGCANLYPNSSLLGTPDFSAVTPPLPHAHRPAWLRQNNHTSLVRPVFCRFRISRANEACPMLLQESVKSTSQSLQLSPNSPVRPCSGQHMAREGLAASSAATDAQSYTLHHNSTSSRCCSCSAKGDVNGLRGPIIPASVAGAPAGAACP